MQGNLLEQSFEKNLTTGRLRSMQESFLRGQAEEELCRRCSYKGRLIKKQKE
jgi:hypothetical protein